MRTAKPRLASSLCIEQTNRGAKRKQSVRTMEHSPSTHIGAECRLRAPNSGKPLHQRVMESAGQRLVWPRPRTRCLALGDRRAAGAIRVLKNICGANEWRHSAPDNSRAGRLAKLVWSVSVFQRPPRRKRHAKARASRANSESSKHACVSEADVGSAAIDA